MKVLGLLLIVCLAAKSSNGLSGYKFPDEVLFGGASAAFLVEGAYVEDGKGWSLWDNLTHAFPEVILGTVKNGDVAADQYHRYEEDIALAASLGHDFYKFGISWPRVLPNGTLDNINQAGIDYYNNLINTIIKAGLEAHVVMFNFDIPMTLERLGGFENETTVDLFAAYADLLYKNFGDRVTTWITFNEAHAYCEIIPDRLLKGRVPQELGFKEYRCGHNILKAHAKAYRNYDQNYRATQGGEVGMAFSMYWYWPLDPNSALDIAAVERARSFVFDWFAHPIFKGDYPQVFKDQLAELSKLEGLKESRLPAFTQEEIDNIRGTYDFLGLNSFFCKLVKHVDNTPLKERTVFNDTRISESTNSSFDFSSVYVNYLDEILMAIHDDGVTVKAYAVWQFMDGFYFFTGLVNRYGLIQVDFSTTNLTRTPRRSAFYLKTVIETRGLDGAGF